MSSSRTGAGPPAIYLDNAATTAVLPEVSCAVARVSLEVYGNPSSRHTAGLRAEEELQRARAILARALSVEPAQVTFTSGGTESNALALLGTARLARSGHLLLSAVEHPSVLDSARLLQREGFIVETVPVTPGGFVEPAEVRARLRPDTLLVALMHVNNETGIVQPVEEVSGLLAREAPRCRLITDCVQSFCTLPVSPQALGAHVVTVSGHKVHGPKGVGALARAAGARLQPLWGGGDQEGGLRPGTENVAGAAGLARAVELSAPNPARLRALADALEEAVRARFRGADSVGDPARRAPHILAMAVPGIPGDVLVNALEARGVCVSSGSACHSRRSLRSHVAEAMGLPVGHGLLRFSLSGTTRAEEIEQATRIIRNVEV